MMITKTEKEKIIAIADKVAELILKEIRDSNLPSFQCLSYETCQSVLDIASNLIKFNNFPVTEENEKEQSYKEYYENRKAGKSF